MLNKLKKQPRQPKASAQVSLADRINAARDEANRYIDELTAKLKADKDGASLPIGVLRHMLTKGSSCACKAALLLIEENKAKNMASGDSDSEEKAKQAGSADILAHKGETIEQYNEWRFGANIIVPPKQKLH